VFGSCDFDADLLIGAGILSPASWIFPAELLRGAGVGEMSVHPVQQNSVDTRLQQIVVGKKSFKVPGRTAAVFVDPR